MTDTLPNPTSFSVTRISAKTGSQFPQFRARFEEVVPPLPVLAIQGLLRKGGTWPEMLDLVERFAPYGFLTYHVNDVDGVMHLAGDKGACVSYLMGNHTIAERMFRFEPAVMLYAPLHVAIWAWPNAEANISFDRPSDQFSSFDNAEIARVGRELDQKLGVLLDHLDVTIPPGLLASDSAVDTHN